jgi:hypothetical protein
MLLQFMTANAWIQIYMNIYVTTKRLNIVSRKKIHIGCQIYYSHEKQYWLLSLLMHVPFTWMCDILLKLLWAA